MHAVLLCARYAVNGFLPFKCRLFAVRLQCLALHCNGYAVREECVVFVRPPTAEK